MEDVVPNGNGAKTAPRTPPPPPEPSSTVNLESIDQRHDEKSDEALRLENEQWDINTVSPLAALRMLVEALDGLAEATGDIPPTPPVSRPTTPRREDDDPLRQISSGNAAAPVPIPPIKIGSPEAHPHEPISVVAANVEDISLQHAAIGRRFFSKIAPSFSLSEYLLRVHKYCPHSPGVYLSAAAYCHRLCVSELMVPATNRTIHRLALASIRISAKALEDNKWRQEWMAKVGGVTRTQLRNLEVALCFLLDFDLWVDEGMLAKRMFLLQQAARQGQGTRGKLSDNFKLKLPLRKKMAMAQAS